MLPTQLQRIRQITPSRSPSFIPRISASVSCRRLQVLGRANVVVPQVLQVRRYAQGGGGGFPGGFPGLSLKPQHQKGEALKEFVRTTVSLSSTSFFTDTEFRRASI